MATNCETTVTDEELSAEETWAVFDEEAQRVLGMSGDEFAEGWRLGKFAETEDPRVTRVAMLLPSAW